MAFKKTFVLSDESLNSQGFWILLSGMDLTGIQANCPLYYNHRTWELPCGHVENIRLDKGRVLGDIVIDGENDIEKEYIRKIQNGDIKGCSLGIDPIEWSSDPQFLKQGQTRETLTKCDPFEVSLAPLPGNKNALALKHNGKAVTLNAETNYDFIPELKPPVSMKKIALALGMPETSTEDQLAEAAANAIAKAGRTVKLQKMVEDHVGVNLSESGKKMFSKLLETDPEAASELVVELSKADDGEEKPAETTTTTTKVEKTTNLKDMVKLNKQTNTAVDGKDSFDYLQKFNPVELSRIRKEDPTKYQQLASDYSNGVRYEGTKK